MEVISYKSANPMSRGNMNSSGTVTLGWHHTQAGSEHSRGSLLHRAPQAGA